VVPTRSGVARRREGHGARAGRRWHAEFRRAPWEWGAVPRARRAPPTEQRTGADRANGSFYPCGSPYMARRLTAGVRWPARRGAGRRLVPQNQRRGEAAGGAEDPGARRRGGRWTLPGALGPGPRALGETRYPHRTLMRPPVVKRQTSPRSGFYPFFPVCFRPSAVRLWPRVPSAFPSAGASNVTAPNTS